MLSTGEIVGARYQIRSPLGPAPAYLAFRAFDRDAEVEVALWLLRPELFPTPRQRDGFLGSVVEMRSLRHPNLRLMFDAGYHGDTVFATVQLDTDDGRVPRPGSGRVTTDNDLLHYVGSVAEALGAAHDARRVHGRLVASDVVHVAGLIKVGGVGLYHDVDPAAASRCYRSQQRFLAPEVRSQAAATPASDVFSLAMLVAELATGKPFTGSGEALAHIARVRPELSASLESAMATAPEQRPQSPATLVDELHAVLVDDQIPTGETASLAPRSAAGKPRSLGFGDGGPTLVDGPISTKREDEAASGGGDQDDPATTTRPGTGSMLPHSDLAAPRYPGQGQAEEIVAFGADELEDDLSSTVDDGRGRGRSGGDFEATVNELPHGVRVGADRSVHRSHQPTPVGAVPPPRSTPPRPSELPAPPPLLPATGSPAIPIVAEVRSNLPPKSGRPVPVGSVPAMVLPRVEATASPRVGDDPGQPVFISRRPKSEPRIPRPAVVPVLERPDMKPYLRSLDSVSQTRSAPPGVLGRYAPPRQGAEGSARNRTFLYLGLVLVAVLVAVGVWLLVTRVLVQRGAEPAPTPPVNELTPGPAPTPVVESAAAGRVDGPCPKSMVAVDGVDVCIDQYESPGRDRMPETGVGLDQARASCRDRGARLCSEAEWERACRGEDDSSYPYGASLRRGLCNVASDSIAVAGGFPACRSAAGAFDMSGNVAEWVEDGVIKGGSATDGSDGRCSRKQRPASDHGFSDVGFRCCQELLRTPTEPAPDSYE